MRLNTNPVKLAVATLFAGGLSVAAIAHAAQPAVSAPPAPRMLGVENNTVYLEHLRMEKRSLDDVKGMLEKEDMADRGNHRHTAIDHVNKAIDELSQEIAEYEKDMKNGK